MSNYIHPIRWLFTAPSQPVTAFRVVGWWELRRIPFNLFVGVFGLLAFGVFATSIYSTGVLEPYEDAVEPFMLLLVPIAANICYTAGWLLDAPLRVFWPSLAPGFSPLLLKLGFGISLLLIAFPAAYWGGYRLLQLCHVIR